MEEVKDYKQGGSMVLELNEIMLYKVPSTEKALREESSDSPRQICTSRSTKYSKILSQVDVSQGMISQQTHIKIDR